MGAVFFSATFLLSLFVFHLCDAVLQGSYITTPLSVLTTTFGPNLFNPTLLVFSPPQQLFVSCDTTTFILQIFSEDFAINHSLYMPFIGGVAVISDGIPLSVNPASNPSSLVFAVTNVSTHAVLVYECTVTSSFVITRSITPLAGKGGIPGYNGDGIFAGNAYLSNPTRMAYDPISLTLYVSDTLNHRVRAITGVKHDRPASSWAAITQIRTVAGNGIAGDSNAFTLPQDATALPLAFPGEIQLFESQKLLAVVTDGIGVRVISTLSGLLWALRDDPRRITTITSLVFLQDTTTRRYVKSNGVSLSLTTRDGSVWSCVVPPRYYPCKLQNGAVKSTLHALVSKPTYAGNAVVVALLFGNTLSYSKVVFLTASTSITATVSETPDRQRPSTTISKQLSLVIPPTPIPTSNDPAFISTYLYVLKNVNGSLDSETLRTSIIQYVAVNILRTATANVHVLYLYPSPTIALYVAVDPRPLLILQVPFQIPQVASIDRFTTTTTTSSSTASSDFNFTLSVLAAADGIHMASMWLDVLESLGNVSSMLRYGTLVSATPINDHEFTQRLVFSISFLFSSPLVTVLDVFLALGALQQQDGVLGYLSFYQMNVTLSTSPSTPYIVYDCLGTAAVKVSPAVVPRSPSDDIIVEEGPADWNVLYFLILLVIPLGFVVAGCVGHRIG
eukprot:PhF_6_TR36535/c2_g1_i1/m.53873